MPRFDHLLFRILFRSLVPILGFSMLGYMLFRTGIGAIWKQVQAVGWGLALIVILGGVAQIIKTSSWRQAFACDIRALCWRRSFCAQLVSDAVGQLGFAGKLFGEGLRISMLGNTVPLANGISSSAIDGGLHTFTAAVVTVSGIAATLLFDPLGGTWRFYALLLTTILTAVVGLAALALMKQWPLMGNTARAVGRLPRLHRLISAKLPVIDAAERNLLAFYREEPAAFWASLMLNLLWHLMAVLEVYLILRFMGARVSGISAFALEGLTKVINLIGILSPGNLGTYEAGNMLIAKLFGVAGPVGLTLALCRRVRAIFWAAIGTACMTLIARGESKSEKEVNGNHEEHFKDRAHTPLAAAGNCH